MITYIKQGWLVLLLGLLFGTALAGVNSWLDPIIRDNERRAREAAALALIPNAGRVELVEMTLADHSSITVFRVLDLDDKHIGWAVPAQGQGYADTIKLIVGVNTGGSTITDMQVIYNQETPGLGNKIEEEDFRRHFRGKATSMWLTAMNTDEVAEDVVQAVTGATISSQAVCDIIYHQLNAGDLLEQLADYPGD